MRLLNLCQFLHETHWFFKGFPKIQNQRMFDSEKISKIQSWELFDPKLIKNQDWNSLISKFKKNTTEAH
jgi:hypothetical protein